MLQFIDASGKSVRELPKFAHEPNALIPFYRAMVFVRAFDEKAVALQRTGRLGTYASSLGEEAVGVGLASAMQTEDVFFPSFREQSAMLWRGVTPLELLLYWGGDERGNDFKGPVRDFPISVPVASHMPHAAGAALAMKLKGEKRAVVAVTGDGGSSKGDFYEAINIAGIWRLPAVFVINNNQWAISVPRRQQTAAETLAQKAVAAGIPGEQVDGNDVVAVHAAVKRALARAWAGKGSSLVEAITYRLSDHTTADDAHRYRSDTEVSAHWKEEPVSRLRTYLVQEGVWSKADEEVLHDECNKRIAEAVEEYVATKAQLLTTAFDFTFASLPADLERQKIEAQFFSGESHD